MKVDVILPSELSNSQVEAWRSLQTDALEHPFFSPDYARLVGEVQPSARVAVIDHESQLGFFPFEIGRGRTGVPIGFRLNDFQGVVIPDEWQVDAKRLLEKCGLNAWRFDHLIDGCASFQPYVQSVAASPYINLSQGYQSYTEQLKQSGSSAVKQTERKARKMAREVGPLRFELHDEQDQPYDLLVQWKTQYIRAKGSYPLLETPWVIELLKRVRQLDADPMKGRLSVLYAGDRVAAVHLGLCNQHVCHWWITSYDVELHQYSPGTILLLRLAEAMADRGVNRLEMGKGDEAYKQRLMTAAHSLGEGSVARTSTRRWMEYTRNQCRAAVRESAWSPLVQKSKMLLRYGSRVS